MVRLRRKLIWPAILALVPTVGLAACGSGSSDSADPSAAERTTPPLQRDSGERSEQFRIKGGDNSVPEFGMEASALELDEAAATLHAYLDARAARAWRKACEHLAAPVSDSLVEQLGPALGGEKQGCAEVLAALSDGIPPVALREAAVADVGALRAEGDSGFLLFRGAQGEDFFVPMIREGGQWRLGAIAASPLS